MIDQLTTTVTDALDSVKLQLSKVTTLDLTNLDLTKLDPRNVDLPQVDLTKLDPRKVNLPQVDLTKLDPRNVNLSVVSDVNLPASAERAVGVARDAVYAGIGAAVIVAERVDAEVRSALRRVA